MKVKRHGKAKITTCYPLKRRAYTLQVHHWNHNPADNRLENLVALCTSCHLGCHRRGRGNVSPRQLSLDFNLPVKL